MYNSLYEIETANARAGLHFFDPPTLRFFRGRVSEDVYPVPGYGAYFVTSEQYRHFDGSMAPRAYTVRFIDANGRTHTVGEFQGYETGRQAKREALRLSLLDHS